MINQARQVTTPLKFGHTNPSILSSFWLLKFVKCGLYEHAKISGHPYYERRKTNIYTYHQATAEITGARSSFFLLLFIRLLQLRTRRCVAAKFIPLYISWRRLPFVYEAHWSNLRPVSTNEAINVMVQIMWLSPLTGTDGLRPWPLLYDKLLTFVTPASQLLVVLSWSDRR